MGLLAIQSFFKTAVSIAMDYFLQTIEKATIKIT
jgi:hypothetical protein